MSDKIPRYDTINLHPEHKAVFVHGFGGSSASAERQAHTLSTYVYNHSPLDSSKITVVVNKAKSFDDVCPEATNRLLDCIQEIGSRVKRSGSEYDESVELVVFCHSNGSKPVQEALDPESLTDLCTVLDIRLMERANFMRGIRDKIVVISFEGVCYIPDVYAKMVMNFRSTSDYFSRFCHHLKLGKQPRDEEANPKAYVKDPATPYEEKEVPAGISGSIAAVGCFLGAAKNMSARKSRISSTASASSDSHARHPHYFENIMKNKGMILYIRKVLGLSVEPTTAVI